MPQELNLFLHNISIIISIIAFIGLALFIFLNNRRREANIALSLAVLSLAIFYISHLFGTNAQDPELSRKIFMLNVSTIFMTGFNLHAIIAFVGQAKKQRWFIYTMHISIILISVLFFVFPDLLFHVSKSKMYFPNYYEPGPLNWVRLTLPFLVIIPYALFLLIKAYYKSKSITEKKQIKYLGLAMVVGYPIGLIPNFLVYDIPIDPLLGIPAGIIFAVPFIYGAIKYELFNIKIIAKQAFIYGLGIGIVGTLIAFLNYSNQWINILYPDFPLWIIYIVSSIFTVSISVIVWHRLRENDFLKYEFITTVAHKFRTPLTVIKWATESLNASNLSETDKIQLSYIQRENSKLVELTNLLIKISRGVKDSYEYKIKKNNLSKMIDETIEMLSVEAMEKNIAIDKIYEPDIFANYDESRTNFVLQVIIENALRYSPKSSIVSISIEKNNAQVICKVTDKGIGIIKEDLPRIFERFYRGKNAKLADTDGMGIGLSISKEIIENQDGTINAESMGENCGSLFTFTLPSVK